MNHKNNRFPFVSFFLCSLFKPSFRKDNLSSTAALNPKDFNRLCVLNKQRRATCDFGFVERLDNRSEKRNRKSPFSLEYPKLI